MKTIRTLTTVFAVALFTSQAALAAPLLNVDRPLVNKTFMNVEADCYAIGQDKAAELGGELAKAIPDTADGVPVCRIVVLIPAQDGARAQRVEVDVPQ